MIEANYITRRYSFKLYPNAAQDAAMKDQCALLAWLWNGALQEREDQWKRELQAKGNWHKVARPKEEKPSGLGYYDQARAIKHIRSADPAYAEMSCASLELCLKALDLAFKAFWRKLKEGIPAYQAGYPRYKSSLRHRTIWHRDGSGWKMKPAGKHWRFYFKGIPGFVKARGRFPLDPDEIRTMEIIERDGAWFASVVTRQQSRRVAGKTALIVTFDLLDEFAAVKNAANGECLPGLRPVLTTGQGRITPQIQGLDALSAEAASDLRADGRRGLDVDGAGQAEAPSDFGEDEILSQTDTRHKRFSYRWKAGRRRAAKRQARTARQRREALHEWTTKIIRHASEITVIAPPIKENTKSAKGDEKQWGAAVKTVATLNRNTLSQAPAMAIAMLEYKAEEAGIPFRKIDAEQTQLCIGQDLPEVAKKARKARRKLKECA